MKEKLEKKLELMSLSVNVTTANSTQFRISRIYLTFTYFKRVINKIE